MKKHASMAIATLICLVVAVVFLADSRSAESSDAGQVGRYQLAVGAYQSRIGEGFSGADDRFLVRRGVFRIDTATGQTWVLNERIDTSSVVEPSIEMEWVPVD